MIITFILIIFLIISLMIIYQDYERDGFENIRVVVRIRPLNKSEKNKGEKSCVTANNEKGEGSVHIKLGPNNGHRFPCNECFPATTSQDVFFEECGAKNLLMAAIEGFYNYIILSKHY